jgi:predicted ribosomally synthesized peptide with nif11-like leader
MSAADVARFESKVKSDPQLLGELHALKGVTDQGVLKEKIAEVGRKHGFSINANEVDSYLQSNVKGGELSDDALSGVAGGSWTYSFPGC